MGVTAAGITGGNPQEMTAAGRTITERSYSPAPTLATVRVPLTGTIAKGGSVNFEITQDADGRPLPNSIYIPHIVIVPTVATIFRVRLFAKSGRAIADPRWYEYLFGAMDESYVNDATGFCFENRDSVRQNRVFGDVAIDAGGASAAAFDIFLLFRDKE